MRPAAKTNAGVQGDPLPWPSASELASRSPRSLRVHFSSATDEWPTPRWLFDALNAEFVFTLDPCATSQNAKCACHFTKTEDGLAQDWSDHTVFMNPPYGRAIGSWMKKAYGAARQGATVVCLVPARTDTTWWHRHAMKGEIRLLRGRLKFEGAAHSAPFPSAIVVFRSSAHAIRAASSPTGSTGDGRVRSEPLFGPV